MHSLLPAPTVMSTVSEVACWIVEQIRLGTSHTEHLETVAQMTCYREQADWAQLVPEAIAQLVVTKRVVAHSPESNEVLRDALVHQPAMGLRMVRRLRCELILANA